jgi:hypothetical protein
MASRTYGDLGLQSAIPYLEGVGAMSEYARDLLARHEHKSSLFSRRKIDLLHYLLALIPSPVSRLLKNETLLVHIDNCFSH